VIFLRNEVPDLAGCRSSGVLLYLAAKRILGPLHPPGQPLLDLWMRPDAHTGDLARLLEKLCLASVGHWVGFLREASRYLEGRPDRALLPLADAHAELLAHRALPAVKAFADRAAAGSPGARAATNSRANAYGNPTRPHWFF
jgi:hypothetical protein